MAMSMGMSLGRASPLLRPQPRASLDMSLPLVRLLLSMPTPRPSSDGLAAPAGRPFLPAIPPLHRGSIDPHVVSLYRIYLRGLGLDSST